MSRVLGAAILVSVCSLLGGCSAFPGTWDIQEPLIHLVGSDWMGDFIGASAPLRDTGGPTIVRPTLTLDRVDPVTLGSLEIRSVDAEHTLDDISQLVVYVDGYSGYYQLALGPGDRAPDGEIVVTVAVPEDDPYLRMLLVQAVDVSGRAGSIVDLSEVLWFPEE